MSKVVYFQTFHQKENMHSNNALLLLNRLYFYNPIKFYELISKWTDIDANYFVPNFITQEKNKNSIPDFVIKQRDFKIIVEAKEKGNSFYKDQMERHTRDLQVDNSSKKIFIALAPKFSNKDKDIFDSLGKNGIQFLVKTYIDFYNDISEICNEYKDGNFLDILESYKDYCEQEKLIDDTNNTIMIRLAGHTMNFNTDNNIYYDSFENNKEGYRYLGLYKDKSVKYIGKISKIATGLINKQGEKEIEFYSSYDGTNTLSDEEKERVSKGLENLSEIYNMAGDKHSFFIVEKFVPVENFVKNSKRALYGKKKFYLDKLGLKPDCPVEDIVEKMKNKNWEDFE